MGKRRYMITDSAKKSQPYYQLLDDLLNFETSFTNPSENHYFDRKSRKSLPYSFTYFNPYTKTIPLSSKSIIALNPRKISKVQIHDDEDKNKMECDVAPTQENPIQDITNQETVIVNYIGNNGGAETNNESSDKQITIVNNLCQDVSNFNSPNQDSVNLVDLSNRETGSGEDSMEIIIVDIEDKEGILSIDIFAENMLTTCSMELNPWLSTPSNKTLEMSMRCQSEIQLRKSDIDFGFSPIRTSESRKMITPRRCKIPPPCLSTPYGRKKASLQRTKWKRPLSSYHLSESNLEIRSRQQTPKLEKRHSYHFDSKATSYITVTPPSSGKKVTLIRRKSIKAISKVITKISEIVFPSSFKQFMTVTTPQENQYKEENNFRQKYMPLPQSPLPAPAKMARLGSRAENCVRSSWQNSLKAKSCEKMNEESLLSVHEHLKIAWVSVEENNYLCVSNVLNICMFCFFISFYFLGNGGSCTN